MRKYAGVYIFFIIKLVPSIYSRDINIEISLNEHAKSLSNIILEERTIQNTDTGMSKIFSLGDAHEL